MLKNDLGQQAFHAFLKTEYAEHELEFILEVQKLSAMPQEQQMAIAPNVYQMHMQSAGGKGIGHQERTSATQDLWDASLDTQGGNVDYGLRQYVSAVEFKAVL